MSNYHRYFFIMPTLAQFELEVHTRAEQGRPLSADVLNGICADLFKEGYGDEVEFDRDADRDHVGAVPAHVPELLRVPVRHGHLGRTRAGARHPGRASRAQSTATSTSSSAAARATRSTR